MTKKVTVDYESGMTKYYRFSAIPKTVEEWLKEHSPKTWEEIEIERNPFGFVACMKSVTFDIETLNRDPFDLLAEYEQRAKEDIFFNKTMIEAVKQYIAENGLTQEEEKGAKEMTREERRNTIKAIEENTKAVIGAYQETEKPSETVERLVESMGYDKAVVAVATVVNRVSVHDGRIYDGVREWARGIEDAPSNDVMKSLGIYGVDSWIHSAHVNQIGEAMKNYEPKEEEPSFPTYPLTDLGEVLETLDENKTVIVYANGSANAPEVARYDGRNSIPMELNSARVHHYAQDINAYYVYLEEMPAEYEDEGVIVEPNNGSGYAHIGSMYDALPKWNMTKDGAPAEGAHEFWQIRKLPQEPKANAIVLRQVATFSEAVEALKEIKREQDTRSELQRMCDDLAEELRDIYDGKIIVEDEEGTTDIGTYDGLLEGDSVSMWDYFMGDAVLDVDYTINSRMEYKGVRLLVTFGGPNIYIDTNRGIVEGCWWTDHAESWIPSEVCATIDDVWAEYYSMMVG